MTGDPTCINCGQTIVTGQRVLRTRVLGDPHGITFAHLLASECTATPSPTEAPGRDKPSSEVHGPT